MFRSVTLENLQHIADGSVSMAFQRHIARAVEDCEDRPGDKKSRKVTLELEIVPVQLQDGSVTEVSMEAKVKSSVPAHVSRPIECKVKQGGKAVFNDLSQDNPNQMTIDEVS